MKESIFDDVTKALATATSRRQALRRIGGILGGTALAGLFPGLALADNSACAHFCNSVFGPGPDRGKCKSDAAHGTGLCYTCGPASPGGTQPICCPQNPDGTCTSYSSATCCGSGQTCTNGTCVATNCDVLSNGTRAQPCTDSSQCNGNFCDEEGNGSTAYCTDRVINGDINCNSDADCPQGTFCDGFFISMLTGVCANANPSC